MATTFGLIFLTLFPLAFHISKGQEGLSSFALSSETSLRADRHFYAAYNKNSNYPECIFVFGGDTTNDKIYCFNINTQSLSQWGNLDGSYTNSEAIVSGSFIESNSNNLYYITWYGNIIKYDLSSDTSTLINNDLVPLGKKFSLLQNPLDSNQLLIIHGDYSNEFRIYDISSDTILTGQDLPISQLNKPFVIVIDNDYFSVNPYLYVFTGETDYIYID